MNNQLDTAKNSNIDKLVSNFNADQRLTINGESIEPYEYFQTLKGRLNTTQIEELEKGLFFYFSELEKAEGLGQTKLAESLKFNANVIVKELELKSIGIDKYVLREDLDKTLKLITPENSIKIIELERYPRTIPDDVAKEIKRVKDLGIFDKMCVVFTDFTDNKYQTKAEQSIVQRNRDPIVFGYFKNNDKDRLELSSRFYFVVDWEDEFCDLTLAKLEDKMMKCNIKKPIKSIEEISKIIKEKTQTKIETNNNDSFFAKLKKFIK